jgi:exodeoxyribonuclease VIII
MARHLMVDLETLATTPDAAILTIGAVLFDPYSPQVYDKFYKRVDLDSVTALGMKIDDNTIEWWSKQSAAAQEEAFGEGNRISIQEAIEGFHKFAWNCEAFWSHGSIFDINILDTYYRALNKATPWNFWQIRDTRTVFDLGFDPELPKVTAHNALADANAQAIGVQTVMKKIGRRA